MDQQRVIFVAGLGLIGGSLAATLKARRLPWHVRAADRRGSALEYALKRGIIDEVAPSLEAGAAGADVVVLAAPVRAIRKQLRSLAGVLAPGQVVTDVGSTKASIVAEAQAAFPAGVVFVGGHPVAGLEQSGVERAEAGLFEGQTCVLTPGPDTPAAAVQTISDLWQDVGAEVVLMEAAVHDRVFALISHLPHMVAYGLVRTLVADLSARELAMGGASLRDFTRVAQSPAHLWRDICLENREALLWALDQFAVQLQALRAAVAAGDEAEIEKLLRVAAEVRGKPWMP